jgi:hypothetical protein
MDEHFRLLSRESRRETTHWYLATETWQHEGCEPVTVLSARLYTGEYVGDMRTARLLEAHGVVPEALDGNRVCTIGYQPRTGRWWGWSHRATKDFATKEEARAFAEMVA